MEQKKNTVSLRLSDLVSSNGSLEKSVAEMRQKGFTEVQIEDALKEIVNSGELQTISQNKFQKPLIEDFFKKFLLVSMASCITVLVVFLMVLR